METPILPQEWLNLRLEFTEEYLNKKKNKKKIIYKGKDNKQINEYYILKPPNKSKKTTNYEETINSYDMCCHQNKKKCSIS